MAWATLRKLRKHGFPVRRQMPLAGYTVDFAIHKARLVIEIDGGVHLEDGADASDAMRDREIERRGWRVVRVSAEMARDADALWGLVLRELGRS